MAPARLPPEFLRDPKACLSAAGREILRSRKNTVVAVPGDGGHPGWIVRHYLPRGLHALVRNSAMASKERNAWDFALEYERRGVATARVVAFVERFEWGIFRESLLASERLEARTLKAVYGEADALEAGGRDPGRLRRAWLRAFAGFLRSAHAAGVYHGDLNAANVLVPSRFGAADPSTDAFVLIDVNRTRFGRPDDAARVAEDLARVGGTPAQRAYLLRRYARDAREYVRLRRAAFRRRALHDLRKRLNRSLGIKGAMRALRLR